MSLDAEQRKQLYRTKLTSLVRSHFSHLDTEQSSVSALGTAGGAVLISDSQAVVLLDGPDPVASLGPALVAARSAQSIELLVEGSTAPVVAAIARAVPAINQVQQVTGRDAVAVTPAVLTAPPADVNSDDPLVRTMEAAGAVVLVRDGVLVGECLGVEVGRIVDAADGSRRMDVGVGEYDQNAFAMMHPGTTSDEALEKVIDEVRLHRRADAEPHPLNRLARSRWLQSILVSDPTPLGLIRLRAVPDLIERTGVRDESPALALGTTPDGALVLVVSVAGVSVSVAAVAAQAVETWNVDRVHIVMPARDRYSFVEETAGLLRVPVEFNSIPDPWPV